MCDSGAMNMPQTDDRAMGPGNPDVQRATQTARRRKPASTRREELTAERRKELELRFAAERMRGKPQSI
jgi:hypothetical protein